MEYYLYIYIFIIVLSASINPFLKKKIITNYKNGKMPISIYYPFSSLLISLMVCISLMIYNITQKDAYSVYILCIILLLICVVAFYIQYIKKKYKQFIWIILLTVIITFVPSFIFLYISKTNGISKINIITRTGAFLLTILIGWFIVKENFVYMQIIPIILIIIGILWYDYLNLNIKK